MMEVLCFGLAVVGAAAGAAAVWAFRAREEHQREKFLSFLAHELNTQVTGLSLTTENLLAGVFGELGDEHRKWMKAVEHRVDLLGCMVGDLRDIAHWEFGGEIRLQVEEVALKAVIDRQVSLVAPTAARQKVQLEMKVHEGLPLVLADAFRLRRVVSSVLHNALKFTASGGTVVFAAAEASGRVRAELRYPHEGPPPDPEEVFVLDYGASDPGHALRTVGAGFGVCRRTLRAMGGDMGIGTAKDGPTTIWFTLPAALPS